MTADFSRTLETRTLDEDSAGFASVLEAIEAWLEGDGVPQALVARLMVAFDEVISNIQNHGGVQGRTPRIDVRIGVNGRSVEAEIRDDGIAFDPLALPRPDTSLSVEQRNIGGLGIHLVRELMDDVRYERCDGANLLRFSLNFPHR